VYEWRDATTNSVLGNNQRLEIATGDNEITFVANSDDCPVDTTFTVSVFDSPLVTIEPLNDGCQEDLSVRANVNPSGNYSYVWSNNGNPVSNGNLQTVNFSTVGNYSLEVLVSNQQTGCTATAGPQDFEVFEEINVNLTSSQACDDGNPVLLRAESNITGLTYNWSRGGDQIADQNTDTLSVQEEGTYRVTAILSACSASDTTNVNRLPTTETGFQENYTYCAEDDINLDNTFVTIEPTNTFIEFEWYSLESNSLLSSDPSLVVSGGEEGRIEARLTNAFGCETVDTVLVENDCEPRIFIPTAFTPNGDGLNDELEVRPRFITNFEIFIFTRWGELIFHSNSQEFKWDGTFNGRELPMGTYAYKVTYRSITRPEEGTYERRGGIT
jgi:gliding motility-associated-like protein